MTIREAAFAGPDDLRDMCDLCIALRERGLGAEHSGDLNWAAYMHAQMRPQRDTRLWWDGAALAAWATHNRYGLTFALSYAQRESLGLMRRVVGWAAGHARAQSAGGDPPAELVASCFASNTPSARLLAELGFAPRPAPALIVNTRPLAEPIPEPALPEGVVVRPPAGEAEIDQRAELHATVWHPSRVTPEGYRITRGAPGYDATLDMVALLPGGAMGAYCICWPERATGTCELEPVGTHPAHRRRGLASAVIYAAMRRAAAIGMRTALVYCSEENLPFYGSLGFRPVDSVVDYARPLAGL